MTNEELQTLIEKANQESDAGNYDVSEHLVNEVFAELRKTRNLMKRNVSSENLLANASLSLSITANRRGNYDIALEQGNRVLALAEEYSLSGLQPKAHNQIGNAYRNLGVYDKSLEYYFKALSSHEELGEKSGIANVTGNIGIVYACLDMYEKSLEFLLRALSAHEELRDKSSAAGVTGNIGNVYQSLGMYDKSIEYYTKALSMHEELGAKSSVARVTSNIGGVYNHLSMYDKALEYMAKALNAYEEIGDKSGLASGRGNIGLVYDNIGMYDKSLEYYFQALSGYEELGEKSGVASILGNIGIVYQKSGMYEKSFDYYTQALYAHEELGEKLGVARIIGNIGSLYSNHGFKGSNTLQAEEYLLKAIALCEEIGAKHNLCFMHKSIASLYKSEKRWEDFAVHFEKYHDIEKELQSEEAKKQAEKYVNEQREAEREKGLAVERALSKATNDILANILPPNITERLLKGEKKIADTHKNVSVLFVDIVGFTGISRQLPASELIDLLDIVFTRFDVICKKHGLEKIKTIGDAYMAVCGAPVSYENHAERTAFAALEMLEDFTEEQEFSKPIDLGFRIGLHSGSVVAGIIGENKYSYDLWGDAVNTASRMESYGEEDKIHVSEEFRNSARDRFTFTERGEIEVKGKGMMKTYFLTGTSNE